MECGIKYVIWILLVLQMIIGFFGFGTGGAVLSALLVIQLNDTMIKPVDGISIARSYQSVEGNKLV